MGGVAAGRRLRRDVRARHVGAAAANRPGRPGPLGRGASAAAGSARRSPAARARRQGGQRVERACGRGSRRGRRTAGRAELGRSGRGVRGPARQRAPRRHRPAGPGVARWSRRLARRRARGLRLRGRGHSSCCTRRPATRRGCSWPARLLDVVVRHFGDDATGGFFDTPDDGERLRAPAAGPDGQRDALRLVRGGRCAAVVRRAHGSAPHRAAAERALGALSGALPPRFAGWSLAVRRGAAGRAARGRGGGAGRRRTRRAPAHGPARDGAGARPVGGRTGRAGGPAARRAAAGRRASRARTSAAASSATPRSPIPPSSPTCCASARHGQPGQSRGRYQKVGTTRFTVAG